MTKKDFQKQAAQVREDLIRSFRHAYLAFMSGQSLESVLLQFDIIAAGLDAGAHEARMYRRSITMAHNAATSGMDLTTATMAVRTIIMAVEQDVIKKGDYKCPPKSRD